MLEKLKKLFVSKIKTKTESKNSQEGNKEHNIKENFHEKDKYDSKDKKELLRMAKEKGLKANANMKKETLISKLRDS